jgi:hypothetical protein
VREDSSRGRGGRRMRRGEGEWALKIDEGGRMESWTCSERTEAQAGC